jgi:hypothetical protein
MEQKKSDRRLAILSSASQVKLKYPKLILQNAENWNDKLPLKYKERPCQLCSALDVGSSLFNDLRRALV